MNRLKNRHPSDMIAVLEEKKPCLPILEFHEAPLVQASSGVVQIIAAQHPRLIRAVDVTRSQAELQAVVTARGDADIIPTVAFIAVRTLEGITKRCLVDRNRPRLHRAGIRR